MRASVLLMALAACVVAVRLFAAAVCTIAAACTKRGPPHTGSCGRRGPAYLTPLPRCCCQASAHNDEVAKALSTHKECSGQACYQPRIESEFGELRDALLPGFRAPGARGGGGTERPAPRTT